MNTSLIELDSPKLIKKQIKELKKLVSDNRKAIDSNSPDTERRITENKSISAEIKILEKTLKAKLNKKTNNPADASPAFNLPAYLTDLHSNLNQSISISRERTDTHEWKSFLASHARTSANHNPALIDATSSFYEQEQVLLVARVNNKIVGGMPLVILDTPLFGRLAASTPYFSYGGPLTDYKDVASALIEYSRKLLAEFKLSSVVIRTCIGGLPYPCFDDKVSMVLRLPETEHELDRILPAKVRSQAKKCNLDNLSLKLGGLELLDDFYKVLSRNMRDLGSPFHSKDFFKNLIIRLPNEITLAVAYHSNQSPISAGLLLAQGGTLEIPWASTIKKANKFNANMWFYYMILKHAVDNQFSHFDFGRSSHNSGTFHFKKQWGAVSAQHYWYKISKEEDAEFRPAQEKFSLLITLWQLMPVWLTNWIGPKIIKGIA